MTLGGTGVELLIPDRDALTQGVTTAAIRATVRISDGSNPDGVRVSVRSTATGYVVEAEVRNGRFLIQGLEAGGPYSITVRRIGTLGCCGCMRRRPLRCTWCGTASRPAGSASRTPRSRHRRWPTRSTRRPASGSGNCR